MRMSPHEDALADQLTTALAARRRGGTPTECVVWAHQVERAAIELLRATVNGARDHHTTWEEIGTVLSVSKQAAQQRFTTRRLPAGAS